MHVLCKLTNTCQQDIAVDKPMCSRGISVVHGVYI